MSAFGALAVLIALAAGAVVFVLVLSALLVGAEGASAEQQAETLGAQLEQASSTELPEVDDALAQLQRDGTVLSSAGEEDSHGLVLPASDDPQLVRVDGEQWVAGGYDLDLDGAGYHVVVARELDGVDEAVGAARGLLAVAVPLLTLLVATLIWFVVGRALRPVERIRAEVEAIGAEDLSRRVSAPASGAELDRLTATMNGLLQRLDASQRTQRRFVSDASHELRSPVAALRQHAQLAQLHPSATDLAALTDVVDAESRRLEEMVDALLVLVRVDEHRGIRREEVDLDDLVLAEAARQRALAAAGTRDAGSALDVVGRDIAPVRVLGDGALLARAIRNAADNARRHARGRIELSLALRDGEAVLRVDDDGAGVPEEERQRVFERFVRLDESRSRDAGGSGLGLAIVAETAAVHGGAASVGRSPLGGARLELKIPAHGVDSAPG